jgi:excisionase family DNA binding protein
MSGDEEVLTVEEIARKLRVNPRTVRNWIASGELPAIDIGRGYRISKSDYDAFIEKRKRRKMDEK